MNATTDEDLTVPSPTGDPHPPVQDLATHDGQADITLPKEFVRHLLDLRDLYENAEAGNTKLESLGEGIQLPVVNELRYAGRHMVDALVCSDQSSSLEELSKAKKHCKRAKYDVAKGGLLYCVRRVTRFKDDYRKLQLLILVPNYNEISRRFADAIELLGKHKNLESKESYYDELEEMLDFLKEDEKNLESMRGDLNKELERLHNEETNAINKSTAETIKLRSTIRNVAIGAGGVILLAIGTGWAIYHDKESAYESKLSECISVIAPKLTNKDPSAAYKIAHEKCDDLIMK